MLTRRTTAYQFLRAGCTSSST